MLGALTKDMGFAGTQIGKINVNEFSTYVAVEAGIAAQALKRLSGGKVKGRSVKVRAAGKLGRPSHWSVPGTVEFQPCTASITAEALNTAVAGVPTFRSSASTPSLVTLAVIAAPPGSVTMTSDDTRAALDARHPCRRAGCGPTAASRRSRSPARRPKP